MQSPQHGGELAEEPAEPARQLAAQAEIRFSPQRFDHDTLVELARDYVAEGGEIHIDPFLAWLDEQG